MFGWHHTVTTALHRGLDAVQQELRALEQDLGLCAACGENLNRTECACTPVWEDPRLAPLKGLLNREKEN